jgi:hypothetical protein
MKSALFSPPSAASLGVGLPHDQFGQNVFAGGVDPVEQQDHQGQQKQVPVGENQRKSAQRAPVRALPGLRAEPA